MKTYVVGFLKNHITGMYLLTEKSKPEFMAGCWNGIGGKIEPGEKPLDAMRRECREETGLKCEDWKLFAIVHRPAAVVYCYRDAIQHHPELPEENDAGERLEWIDVREPEQNIKYFTSAYMLMILLACDPVGVSIIHLDEPFDPALPQSGG